mgnify:CR=1 FL=1
MYTLELYKTDARTKAGERLVEKRDMMNGKEFKERYDTPYYCSPSSETYWSM